MSIKYEQLGLKDTYSMTTALSSNKNQANPVSGTEYDIVDLSQYSSVIVFGIRAYVTWSVAVSSLQVHIYLDGTKVITHGVNNPVSGTVYYGKMAFSGAIPAQTFSTTDPTTITYAPLWGELPVTKLTLECTGGTANPIVCRVTYVVRN